MGDPGQVRRACAEGEAEGGEGCQEEEQTMNRDLLLAWRVPLLLCVLAWAVSSVVARWAVLEFDRVPTLEQSNSWESERAEFWKDRAAFWEEQSAFWHRQATNTRVETILWPGVHAEVWITNLPVAEIEGKP